MYDLMGSRKVSAFRLIEFIKIGILVVRKLENVLNKHLDFQPKETIFCNSLARLGNINEN